jgi:D-cysteine desulfhydrase
LILGRRLLRAPTEIIGISDGEPADELTTAVLEVASAGAAVLRVDERFTRKDVTIYDEYAGEGYGIPTPEMVEAVRLVARTEGIVLDPVYSGKAMAGLMDLIRQGQIDRETRILLLPTGGTPALFAYANAFAESAGFSRPPDSASIVEDRPSSRAGLETAFGSHCSRADRGVPRVLRSTTRGPG